MAYAARQGFSDLSVSSAGTRAVIGHPIHRDAALVLQRLGGDSSHFIARQITPKIASSADLILTMTRAHRDDVLECAPHRLHRTFTMIEAFLLATAHNARTVSNLASLRPQVSTDESLDIPDPIGHSAEVFATVGAQIADLLPPIIDICRRSATSGAE
uniref:Protein tyrosine phosphatase n=1 Tax=Mycobacterium sp. (strain MCS) TaxID=164756 RepID=A0A5Q5BFQ4_MYCSS